MTTILIVDDEREMAGILRDNLVVEGYEAITAADGVSAVDTALKRRV